MGGEDAILGGEPRLAGPELEPELQGGARPGRDRHHPLPPAFAAHQQEVAPLLDGAGLEADQLRHPEPGGIDELDETQKPVGALALAAAGGFGFGTRPCQQAATLRPRSSPSAAPLLPASGGACGGCRIVAGQLLGEQEAVKLPHRRQPPLDGRSLEARVLEARRISAHILGTRPLERGSARFEITAVIAKIAAIGIERVRSQRRVPRSSSQEIDRSADVIVDQNWHGQLLRRSLVTGLTISDGSGAKVRQGPDRAVTSASQTQHD